MLQKLYDYVIPVEAIVNPSPAHLALMDRWDLRATFTKIHLWRQLRFRKIVYLDADVVVLRAPDELFDLQERFAAAPDVGWPDCFNSGVLVLTPNMADFHSLSALAQRGVSFDGADQGLLNMHFKTFHRLSFCYNCTPSAHYQYLPAYRHFEADISILHFIGKDKPWSPAAPSSRVGSIYGELLGRWWAVYGRHFSVPVGFWGKEPPEIATDPRADVPHHRSWSDRPQSYSPVLDFHPPDLGSSNERPSVRASNLRRGDDDDDDDAPHDRQRALDLAPALQSGGTRLRAGHGAIHLAQTMKPPAPDEPSSVTVPFVPPQSGWDPAK